MRSSATSYRHTWDQTAAALIAAVQPAAAAAAVVVAAGKGYRAAAVSMRAAVGAGTVVLCDTLLQIEVMVYDLRASQRGCFGAIECAGGITAQLRTRPRSRA